MAVPIRTNQLKTNQLEYKLIYEEIDKNYDIFIVEKRKYFEYGAEIIDAPGLDKNVCAVCFIDGSQFYVLMRHDEQNKENLKNVLDNSKGGDAVIISKEESCNIEDWILLQLLLNSLGRLKETSGFNNLTGHFYHINETQLNKEKTLIQQIIGLEIRITKEYRLCLDVRTFSSKKLEKYMTFKPNKKFESYPQYIIEASTHTNTLRRKLKDDREKLKDKTEHVFIRRQIKGKKSSIKFLDISTLKEFQKSKLGILAETIIKFNKEFANIAQIDIKSIAQYNGIDTTRYNDAKYQKFISEKFNTYTINIVDMIDNEESQKICNEIKEILSSKYKLNSQISKKVTKTKNSLNICLLHEKKYYLDNKIKDPYKKEKTRQHITLEIWKNTDDKQNKGKTAIISTLLHESLIKLDLQQEKINIFNWSELGLKDNISFIMAESEENESEENESKHYFLMCIRPDGTFTIEEIQESNLFEQEDYGKCEDIFKLARNNPKNIKGVICDSNGNFNIIYDTEWFTIPEILNIREELEKIDEIKKANKNKRIAEGIRNKPARERLFPSICDIKYFRENDEIYYFAGVIGNGMETSINTAVNIRKIIPYKNSELFFDEWLLKLMDVPFVHNKQLTVIPFPFKYLREFIEQSLKKEK